MKFWQALSFAEPEQLVEIAQIAEQVGFEGVFVSDHLVHPEKLESRYPYSETGQPVFTEDTPWPECWTAIGAMATATTKLRFATMVHILPLRNPIEVAKSASTAAVLSRDRVALGAGAGWIKEEYDLLGVDFKTRGRRFDECIEVLRKLWTGEMVDHQGEFFDFPRILMRPAPARHLPILIGGVSPVALRRAARLGDGWLGSGQTPDEAVEIAQTLSRLRAEAGREKEPFEIVAPLVTPPDPDTFRRLEEHGVAGTVSYPFLYSLGPTSTLDAKRAVMEQYGDAVIAKSS
jgi:probable F420-dependent oxidoreductase